MRAALFLLLGIPAFAQVFHPSLSWSTFLAGTAYSVRTAVDAQGNIYLAATVNSTQAYDANFAFAAIPPCPQLPCRDELVTRDSDVYVAKLSADGTRLLWSRLIGGSGADYMAALTVSAAGDVYLAGGTASPDFPLTKGAFSTIFHVVSGPSSGFLVHLDPDGNTVYATFVDMLASALALDRNGNLVFTGGSSWTQIAATPGTVSLAGNGITGRLNAAGSKMVQVLRGVGGLLLAVDGEDNIVIAGAALHDYSTTPGAFQATAITGRCGSSFFAFECGHQVVTKVAADGSKLIFSTFLSGVSDTPQGLALDAAGNIYVGGSTQTGDYPVTAGAYQTRFRSTVTGSPFGGINAQSGYVSKLAADGASLIWSTLIGGRGADFVSDLKLAPDGTVYVVCNLTVLDFSQVNTLGAVAGEPVVLGFSGDGSSLVSAFTMPAPPSPSSTVVRSFLTLNAAGGLTVAKAPVVRTFPVAPGTASSNPDPARIPSGVYLAKLDLTRAAPAAPAVTIRDAMDLQPLFAVAPGQLVTLFAAYELGADKPTAGVPESGFYPAMLAGTQVLFDGVAAPLLYTAPDQIDAAAPYGIAAKSSVVLTVRQNGVAVFSQLLPVTSRNPAFFMPMGPVSSVCSIDGQNYGGFTLGGIIANQDGSLNRCSNPARPATTLDLFLNGVGPVPGAASDGAVVADPAPTLAIPFQVQINGRIVAAESAAEVPGWIAGVWRLRVRIPTDIATNVATFAVTLDGVPAQPKNVFAWVTLQ